jgi:hypothetical protein
MLLTGHDINMTAAVAVCQGDSRVNHGKFNRGHCLSRDLDESHSDIVRGATTHQAPF